MTSSSDDREPFRQAQGPEALEGQEHEHDYEEAEERFDMGPAKKGTNQN
jgi:hypothetical protein